MARDFRPLTLVALLLLSVGAQGAPAPRPLKDPDDTRALASSVMQLVAADKINAAFEELKPYWPLPDSEIDAVILKTIAARNTAADRFGATVGYALIREEKISDFLIRYTYAEKREHHVLRWIFYFYKPHDSWAVNSVSWDDNVQGLF